MADDDDLLYGGLDAPTPAPLTASHAELVERKKKAELEAAKLTKAILKANKQVSVTNVGYQPNLTTDNFALGERGATGEQ